MDVTSIPMTELIQLAVPACLARVLASLDEEAYCGFSSVLPLRGGSRDLLLDDRGTQDNDGDAAGSNVHVV